MRTGKLKTLAFGLGMLSVTVSARHGVAKGSVAALTPMDYIEIQQLVARYGYALDTGAPEGTGSEYAGLFTPDGVFVGPGIPDNTDGRDKLAALARIPADGRARRGPTYVSHFLMNHLIEPSPEGARGTVYLLVVNFGEDGKASSLSMGGHYDDVYAKTAEGWRFKKREFFRGKTTLRPHLSTSSTPVMRPVPDAGKPAKDMLSAMDYIEIRKLVAGYAYGLDGGADNAYQYADLFAPGAVLFGRTTGRENNREPGAAGAAWAGVRPSFPDQRADRAFVNRGDWKAVSRGYRYQRKRDAELDLPGRALRRRIREDTAGVAVQITEPRAGEVGEPIVERRTGLLDQTRLM
jgi:SnoaL-like protein